ncbi:lamin tail domain-containing protein [Hamadaea tsunoensis]|uniref:lamin tail domain-containing protein n=1 Tax=Hamadaea tsunoensis TaxID=53368 RepID=UPI000412CF3B|nr:lamin tail domain-containing protein [Hamadaea tsunoensis]
MLRRLPVLLALLAAAVVPAALTATPASAATPSIMITKVLVNPSGSDTTANSQLVREYIVLKNTTRGSINLNHWTVRDRSNHVYTFGSLTLGAGKSVTLHTGKGANTSTNRYWGLGWYVWNNTGDGAYVRNSAGKSIDSCSWGSVSVTYC